MFPQATIQIGTQTAQRTKGLGPPSAILPSPCNSKPNRYSQVHKSTMSRSVTPYRYEPLPEGSIRLLRLIPDSNKTCSDTMQPIRPPDSDFGSTKPSLRGPFVRLGRRFKKPCCRHRRLRATCYTKPPCGPVATSRFLY